MKLASPSNLFLQNQTSFRKFVESCCTTGSRRPAAICSFRTETLLESVPRFPLQQIAVLRLHRQFAANLGRRVGQSARNVAEICQLFCATFPLFAQSNSSIWGECGANLPSPFQPLGALELAHLTPNSPQFAGSLPPICAAELANLPRM
jgi:hypothetical protein